MDVECSLSKAILCKMKLAMGFEFWLHSFVAPSWESPFPFPFQLDALTAIAMPQ